ncbi:MAG: DUF1573 domain-containing protein [Calditrichaeota bacterium]|nr:DUF1573 domain-containing protein [Calditrichota bacterium]
MGEEEREFNLADVDSITYTDFVLSLSVEPEAIEFGEVSVRDVEEAILTVNNTGNGELIITSIELEEGVFFVLFENPVFIAPENSIDFTVSFSPEEIGNFANELIIHSNSPVNPEVAVPLAGTGSEEIIWEYEQTDNNMSVVVQAATINEESLVEGDLIGVFTQIGLCAGNSEVPEDFPEEQIGLSAWGADRGDNNGFQNREQLNFLFWDADARQEVSAEIEEIIVGDPVYTPNGIIVLRLMSRGFNWRFFQTDIAMNILVVSALIGDESLSEDDAIGVFTPDGQCAGFAIVPDRFPDDGVGIAVWGADRGMDNGFQDGEQLIFKFWDSDAQQEYLTDFEIIVGDWAFFSPNAFLIISLTARE